MIDFNHSRTSNLCYTRSKSIRKHSESKLQTNAAMAHGNRCDKFVKFDPIRFRSSVPRNVLKGAFSLTYVESLGVSTGWH